MSFLNSSTLLGVLVVLSPLVTVHPSDTSCLSVSCAEKTFHSQEHRPSYVPPPNLGFPNRREPGGTR